MNIDLDSWEAGYADGQHGRPPQCAIGLDQVSYLAVSAMVARGVRSRALRAHPFCDRLYSALVRYDDHRQRNWFYRSLSPAVASAHKKIVRLAAPTLRLPLRQVGVA
jgi:hypothetical protein